jgi:hypothetical protein
VEEFKQRIVVRGWFNKQINKVVKVKVLARADGDYATF